MNTQIRATVTVAGIEYVVPGPVAYELERLRFENNLAKDALNDMLTRERQKTNRVPRAPQRLRKTEQLLPPEEPNDADIWPINE